MLTKLITILALAALVFLGARFAVPRLSGTPAAGGVILDDNNAASLAACPADSQNCASDTLTAGSDPTATFESLIQWIDNTQKATLVTQSPDYLHAIWQTPLMGYIDDVEFLLDSDAGEIQVRSVSRLGRSDLGANRKRIESIRRYLSPASR